MAVDFPPPPVVCAQPPVHAGRALSPSHSGTSSQSPILSIGNDAPEHDKLVVRKKNSGGKKKVDKIVLAVDNAPSPTPLNTVYASNVYATPQSKY
jgi:hypothetical protein